MNEARGEVATHVRSIHVRSLDPGALALVEAKSQHVSMRSDNL